MVYNPNSVTSISKSDLSVRVDGFVPNDTLNHLFTEIVEAAISAPSNFKPMPLKLKPTRSSVKSNKQVLMASLVADVATNLR